MNSRKHGPGSHQVIAFVIFVCAIHKIIAIKALDDFWVQCINTK